MTDKPWKVGDTVDAYAVQRGATIWRRGRIVAIKENAVAPLLYQVEFEDHADLSWLASHRMCRPDAVTQLGDLA